MIPNPYCQKNTILMKLLLHNFIKGKKKEVKKRALISSLAPKILTKKEDIEKIQPYLDKLNETIDTKGINNIALTGGYGSGKSTIIGTFKELNPQYKFLNISLASFNKKKSDDKLTQAEQKLQKEELERSLEVSILQQIFYHVKPHEIPESRFKRIINIPNWKIWGISVGFILWVSSSILLLKYDYLDKINPNNWSSKDSFDWLALIIFLIAFIGLGLFSKLIVKLFSNSKINKVNIKGELELGDNINKSVFNEYLEEILYFFERTEYNVVVIEDLDRFDSTDIFTKLREINILLNNSKLIEQEISFVYAVGDDLFDDKKERVKFFEYIIPVIPFINSSNADEQLRTLIKEAELDENIFTKEFISDVTTFIDDIDMRLLTNIFHEFVIYRKTLKPEFIKKNDELFAMITYKNIDPKDFTKLNKKEGKLFELINNKRNYIKKFISKIDTEITYKNSQIEEIETHTVNDIKELRAIYINKVLSMLPTDTSLNKNKVKEFIEDEGFETIMSGVIEYEMFTVNRSYYSMYSKATNTLNFDFDKIENEINSDYTYEERAEFIESKRNNKIDVLKKEIAKLKSNKSEIENWNLKQIFNEIDINEYLNDFSNNGLLRNFILNGYINENYNDYISLFHEVSITKEDFTFERNVKGGYSTDFNFKLSNKIENLVEKIDEKYFERETILNFDLLDYLGDNYSKYSDKYDSIIRLLSNEKEKSIQFINEYIKNEDRPIEIFIKKLVKNWNGFIDYVFLKENYDRDTENKYLELIIRFSEVETIINNQNTATLKNVIDNTPYFLSLIKNTDDSNYFRKVSQLLKKLNIKFEKLDNPTEETEKMFDYVYNNNHYEINEENISLMMREYGNDAPDRQLKLSNYSIILSLSFEPLKNYVHSEIDTYVNNVFLKISENISETEESLILLLNNKDLKENLKIKVIQKVETKISDLRDVNNFDVKTELLLNNKVIADWSNVIEYYILCENKINETLIKFLNFENVYSKLAKEKLIKENKDFEVCLVKCGELSNNAYNSLLDSTYYHWNNIDFKSLNIEKIYTLLEKRLNLAKENYDLLRNHFPDNHITLIEKDFESFIQNIEDFETDTDDILMILQSENINADNKFEYINQLEQSIIIENKELSKIAGNIILRKSTKVDFEYSTIESLVINTTSSENKVRLVNLYFNDLDNANIVSLLKNILGYDKLFEKGKPTYGKSDFNNTLFGKLKTKNLIKNYYDDKWNDSNFRVTTNY